MRADYWRTIYGVIRILFGTLTSASASDDHEAGTSPYTKKFTGIIPPARRRSGTGAGTISVCNTIAKMVYNIALPGIITVV